MIKQAILKTLIYSDIFNFPLTIGEIHQYLVSSKKTTPAQLKKTLDQLVKQNKVIELNSSKKYAENRVGEQTKFYTLQGRGVLVDTRLGREKTSREKLNKTRNIINQLKLIPTIQAIYLTGSLAMNNATKNDDVDIMIITKPSTLWTTRILVNLYLDLLKNRRKPKDRPNSRQVSNKICPNLYLDSNNLKISKNRQNLYTAHEVVQAKLLWQKDDIHHKFLTKNNWVKNFLPHSPLPQIKKTHKKNKKHSDSSLLLLKIIEKISYNFQLWYMSNKKTQEEAKPNKAFFHPRNTSQIILNQYQQGIDRYLS